MQILLIVALSCAPIMLYTKPIILYIRMAKHAKQGDHAPKKETEVGLLGKQEIDALQEHE